MDELIQKIDNDEALWENYSLICETYSTLIANEKIKNLSLAQLEYLCEMVYYCLDTIDSTYNTYSHLMFLKTELIIYYCENFLGKYHSTYYSDRVRLEKRIIIELPLIEKVLLDSIIENFKFIRNEIDNGNNGSTSLSSIAMTEIIFILGLKETCTSIDEYHYYAFYDIHKKINSNQNHERGYYDRDYYVII